MSTYVITGTSRGLGYEFLRQLSSNPSNTIVGLVRDKAATDSKVAADFSDRKNIHILKADLMDYESLKQAAKEAAQITGGVVDVLIANAAYISIWSAFDGMGELGTQDPVKLEKELFDSFKANTVANVYLFNLFLPMIRKGQTKKVITITSGMGETDLTAQIDLYEGGPYSISKSAMNQAVAKYSAEYAKEGILFMSVAPGFVDVGQFSQVDESQAAKAAGIGEKFKRYAPHFTGPTTPPESIKDMMSVIERSSVTRGDGGAHVSQFGNKQWL